MSVNFTVLEIFEIAQQIEHNAAKFYRDTATVCIDRAMQQFFLELAKMEDNHEKIFADMKKNLENEPSETKVFDPNNEIVYYLKAIAKSAGWEGKSSPHTEFAGYEQPRQVIKIAIEAEKASINYYLGLKEFVASPAGKTKVDDIIKEEMKHVITLQKHLEKLDN